MKRLLAAFLVLLSFAAWAEQCLEYQAKLQSNGTIVSGWVSSYASAAQAGLAWWQANGAQACNYLGQPGTVSYSLGSVTSSVWQILQVCSSGGGTTTYNNGYNTRTVECVQSCSAGQSSIQNPTTGWGWITGFSGDTALVKGAPGMSESMDTSPPLLCDGQCSIAAVGAPTEYWVSKEPTAQGLHRMSTLQNYETTGADCSGQGLSDAIGPAGQTGPSCPGTLGEVNGKTVCLSNDDVGNSVPAGPRSVKDGTSTTGTMGPNGEISGGGQPAGTAGGSTPGTGTGTTSTPGGSSSVPSDGTSTTTVWGGYTDKQMPGVPVLYTRKYSKEPGPYFTEVMSGSGAALAPVSAAMFPSWSGSGEGACPQFAFSLNLGAWDYGDISPNIPCVVWDAARIIMLISALFLARRLIFGG